jgi:RimJ/RimL family protein N-acetyltransferase
MATMQAAVESDPERPLSIDLHRWTSSRTLRSGSKICIRPLRADDREREVAFIESLSEQTRYFRFMSPLRFLPPHLLDQLMRVDYAQNMAFAVTLGAGDAEEFIALGRYGKTDQPDAVELGITVTDRWHRHGIARMLIDQLVHYASEQGFRKLIGWVLYDNAPMLALARASGFRVRIAPQHGGLEIIRELASTAPNSDEARGRAPATDVPTADCAR